MITDKFKKAQYKMDHGESQEIIHKIPKSIEIGSAKTEKQRVPGWLS